MDKYWELQKRVKKERRRRREGRGRGCCRRVRLDGGTEPLGGSVALHGRAWHYANLQWTYKCKGGEERSETYVSVLSEILSPNDAEAAQERLIMAVRDVSDKIYPDERVELQG